MTSAGVVKSLEILRSIVASGALVPAHSSFSPPRALSEPDATTSAMIWCKAELGHRNIQHTVRHTKLSPTRFKDFWRD
jgi:hypothetical protein